jgi:hypothetical protein
MNDPSKLSRHDEIYQKLVDLHEGKTVEESLAINAKLVLMLANEIGDAELISNLIDKI